MDPISLLQDLIRIPSVNPDNAPGTDKTGEQTIANYLEKWFKERNFDVIQEEVRPGRPNLIARSKNKSTGTLEADPRPRILLCPHTDTVGVGNMTINPFGGEISDNKIWGRGSSDTKGPMAAMLAGIDANLDLLDSLPVAVDFAGFMGEESSQHGSKHFAEKYAKDYLFAIAAEPTSLDLVHLTKGSLWFTIEATGKAAHSSQPQLGENAILKMANAITILNEKLNLELAKYPHPQLGNCTLNIGTISGGSRPNIVPDFCTVDVDIRLTPQLEKAGGAMALVNKVITDNQLPITVSTFANNPPMECPSEHPIIEAIQQTRSKSQLTTAPWFSDAAHLSAAGIPAIAFGPGSIDQAHTKDEFIKVDDFLEGCAFFKDFIKQLQNYS